MAGWRFGGPRRGNPGPPLYVRNFPTRIPGLIDVVAAHLAGLEIVSLHGESPEPGY